jgi:hypothetical protein
MPTARFFGIWLKLEAFLLLSLVYSSKYFASLKELEDHTDEVNLQREVLDGMFTFYDSTTAQLNIYQVFEVIFFAPFMYSNNGHFHCPLSPFRASESNLKGSLT